VGGLQSIKHQNITSQMIASLIVANDLHKEYDLPDYEQLDQLKHDIGVRYLNELLSRGRLKHWASEPDSALLIANEAKAVANRLNLNYVEEINVQYDKLLEQAGKTYCEETLEDFNSMLNEANLLFTESKINEALLKTNQVRELVYLKSYCGLSTAPINRLLLKYKNHIKWNELVTEALELFANDEYQQSLQLIEKAESIYSYYRLDSLGITNISYFDLAIESNNPQLLKHAVGNQISRSKYEEAFQLLERLRLKGYPAEDCSHLLETLARNIALKDKSTDIDLNVNDKLRSYTKDIKWYSRFDVVYKYYTKSENNTKLIFNRLRL
jgi:hypothetical protein